MNQDNIMKMLATQLGQSLSGTIQNEHSLNSTWLEPFKEKAKQFIGTPYHLLSEVLIDAGMPQSIGHFTAILAAGFADNQDPLNEHPEILDTLTDPENPFLSAFWPPEWVSVVAKSIEYAFYGTYQSPIRSRYRSRYDKSIYAILPVMTDLFAVNHICKTPEAFALERMKNEMLFSASLAPFLAVMLDSENAAVTEAFRTAIYENSGTVSRELVLSLFFSKQESSWEMAADLLLAAKLQEGLRQTVLENCSNGRVEAFRYMMHVIADNDLLRYPATICAFNSWLGIEFDTVRVDTVRRMFASALAALEDPENFNADNPRDLFIQLWAMANTEVFDAKRQVEKLLMDGSASLLQLSVALTFYKIIGYQLPDETALDLFRRYRDNFTLLACILGCYKSSADSQISSEEASRLYFEFKKLLPYFPKKKLDMQHPAFEWSQLHLSVSVLWINILLPLAKKAWNASVLDDLAQSMPGMPSDVRHFMLISVLEYLAPKKAPHQCSQFVLEKKPENDKKLRESMPNMPTLRNALFRLLEDKSSSNREEALSIISRMKITEAELLHVENLLAQKNSSIRRIALEILLKSDNPQASAVRLRASCNTEKIAAADELMPKVKEAPVIDKVHGYGLYDVHEIWNPNLPKPDIAYHPKNILRDESTAAKQLLSDLSNLLNKHRQDECKGVESPYSVSVIDTTLDKAISIYQDVHWTSSMTQNIPMPELWDGYFAIHPLSIRDLVHAFLLLLSPEHPDVREEYFGLSSKSEKYDNAGFLRAVIHRQLKTMSDFPEFATNFCIASVAGMPESFWKKRIPFYHSSQSFIAENDEIQSVFALFDSALLTPDTLAVRYSFCRLHPGDEVQSLRNFMLPLSLMLEAFDKKFITQNTLRRLLLTSEETRFGLRLSSIDWNDEHPEIRVLIEDAVKLELRRGEMPTGLSRGLGEIRHLRGAFFFAGLLNALGSQALIRGYAWGAKPDKATTFSHLLKICRPLPEDNAESFKKQLAPFHFSEKRLLEAAMYSPAWLDLIGTYLNIPALPMVGWYFHAHLHEQYSFFAQEKESYVSRYSPVSLQEFSDGAFDINWFHEAYNAVRPEMFSRLYDAAKYISGGANHRRSQIFTDAALGKLSEAEVEEKIKTKRNKEYVMAYGILPGKANDFPRRYENLMKFKKESRQFGEQRQASEKLAVEIAVANLARTAGFSDVNRFLWRMEAANLDKLNALFAPHEADGVTLSLAIDSDGRAEIRVKKAEKKLKSIPASLKKDAYVLELQSAVKSLRDQHSRARKSLEDAMIREDVFEYVEVRELMSNPVLGPLASKLLWQAGDTIDFFEKLPEIPLKIAHPTGLLRSGRWAEFQRLAMERKLVQPFKQIFRELYTLNADEKLDGMKSARYSGNQVMPKKAVALLRTRGWTVDMEEGLQKVFHRQNLIAKIYAMADWFSPAEVEPPTLEYVHFEHRRTGEIIPLEKIVPVLFSEVMRDLDLMVSVAHAGGVDPEASHSTVEMRAALIRAMLPLFKLDNVRIEKSHAFITGKFGEYTVHLGSGVCHKQASGMLNILPVHSQTRGRIFLPFADDDPKTAEVLTKILFLAEDDKIKDPSILEQIKGGLP